MKVRILSGNARGQIVEMSQIEAEVNIATGYAEAVPAESHVVAPVEAEPEKHEPRTHSRR
jgi:hypothetical protein